MIGGVDWNKSPTASFQTTSQRAQHQPNFEKELAKIEDPTEREAARDAGYSSAGVAMGGEDAAGQRSILGLSVEIFVVAVIVGLIILLVLVGTVYRFCCGRKRLEDYDDEDVEEGEDDEEEDEDEKEDLAPEKNVT